MFLRGQTFDMGFSIKIDGAEVFNEVLLTFIKTEPVCAEFQQFVWRSSKKSTYRDYQLP